MSTITTQLNSNISVAYTPICGGTTTGGPIQSVASLGSSGTVLTSNGAGNLPTFQAVPSSGILSTSVTLTQSQIVACHTTPVQLIAGQGANTIVVILDLVFKLVIGATPYALTGNSFAFGFGSSSTTIPGSCVAMPISGGAIASVSSSTIYFSCSPFTGSVSGTTSNPLVGTGVGVTSGVNTQIAFTSTTNNPTGGTGSGNSTIFISYMVMTVT